MSIKSHFLPSSALQGEEIPSFILWHDLDYDRIEITKSECCELIEFHNVNDEEVQFEGNKILINKVEVDGYLGLLLKSERTDNLLINAEMSYTFFKNDAIVKSVHNEISLFKPQLKIQHVPDTINLKGGKILDSEKIVVSNIGEGTCRIRFKNTEDSELLVSHPKRIKEFVDGFNVSFEEGISNIEEEFKEYTEVFDIMKWLINTIFDPSNEDLLKKIDDKLEILEDYFEADEKLYNSVIRIYASSLLKNMSIITPIQQFLDYLRSTGKNRIKLLNALDSITVGKKGGYLEIEISYTDLINSKIPSIILPKIFIKTDEKTDISLYNLFVWDGGKEE